MSFKRTFELTSLLAIGAASLALAGCAGAPLGLDMGQKPMAGIWKGDFICPQLQMSKQSITITLQDGNLPGAVNGVVENHLIYAGQPQYLKYTVVGSNIGGHVVLKPKQLIQRSREDFMMGSIEGDMADANTLQAVSCKRQNQFPIKRVASTEQSALR